MRLLLRDRGGKLTLTHDITNEIPPYAILSHTWGADEDEVTYHDLKSKRCAAKPGYKKIQFCVQQAASDRLHYSWVDTCCIDKTNHVELSEAITSMYRWYSNAQICYVYLADVSSGFGRDDGNDYADSPWEQDFRRSRWFTRGWTLQELLAPKDVRFYSKEGHFLGTKNTLKRLLHKITRIPTAALDGRPLSLFSTTERMLWTQGRTTKRKEDQAYCLLGIFNVFMYLNYGEGDNAFIRLTEEINKTPSKIVHSLKVAPGAMFKSYSQTHQECHPATRVDLLQSVRAWTRDPNGKCIFWLSGAAGTGKSTVSWTIAKWLADLGFGGTVALGATFFFRRGECDQAMALRLFPTIASQLASRIPSFDTILAQAVTNDPYICSKSLAEQFNKLIFDPLQSLRSCASGTTYVIVVDALDECESEADIGTVLKLWSRLQSVNTIRLRLFLTSRPELPIRLGFKKMSTEIHQDLTLHEIPRQTIRQDIFAFLSDALAEVRHDYNLALDDDLLDEQLSVDWPGKPILNALTEMATPLFIVAATIYRLVRDADHPQRFLSSILSSRKTTAVSDVGKIYVLVLQSLTKSIRDPNEVLQALDKFRMIVGAIISLGEPVSRVTLSSLLDIRPIDIQTCLRSFYAVLDVPSDGSALIRPFHLSFGEYLTGQELYGTPYWIDTVAVHMILWKRCLQLLSDSKGLRENICHLSYPGQPRSDLSVAQINEYIDHALRYACRYWVEHVQLSTYRIHDGDEIHLFLLQHLLHWLEALSFMNRLTSAIGFVETLQAITADENSLSVTAFLEDARRFIMAFRYVADLAPLQLYSSAIVFAPQNGLVRRACLREKMLSWVRLGPITPPEWNLELQKLEGNVDVIEAIAFSPDGLLLSSASRDRTVRLWSVSAGQELQRFEEPSGPIRSMAFSSDSCELTTMSHNTIIVWDIKTGHQILRTCTDAREFVSMALSFTGAKYARNLRDYTVSLLDVKTNQKTSQVPAIDSLRGMMFAPDNSLLVRRLNDCILIYDANTGRRTHAIAEYKSDPDTYSVTYMAASFSGSMIALTLVDQTIRLYNLKTHREVLTFPASVDPTGLLAFSPCDRLLASTSEDKSVRIWDTATGELLEMLEGHTERVHAMAFSPDSSMIASAGSDGTIRLWNTRVDAWRTIETEQDFQMSQRARGMCRLLAFSPDASLLASAASGPGWQLWDATNGQPIRNFEQDVDRNVVSALAFSQDSTTLAVAQYTIRYTVQLWDVRSGQKLQELERHTARVDLISFSDDGMSLAVASCDGTVQLWNLMTGQTARSVDKIITRELSFSPNSDTVITEQGHLQHSGRSRALQLFPSTPPTSPSQKRAKHDLRVDGAWITCHKKRLLWLPQEYRSDISAVRGNAIAIGPPNGGVHIFRIKCPLDPEHRSLVERAPSGMLWDRE